MRSSLPLVAALALALAACAHPQPSSPPVPSSADAIDCDEFVWHPTPVGTWTAVDPPGVVDGRRIDGSPLIEPTDDERRELATKSISSAWVKLCLGPDGVPTSLTLLRDTGLPGWNRRICESMKRWRYTPYRRDGAPIAVCTRIELDYFQTPRRPR